MHSSEARDLVRQCAKVRDADLWQEFLERFGCRLRTGVQRAIQRFDARVAEDEREDLLQEVYCRLLDNRGKNLLRCRGQGDVAVSAYLGRVAESVVVDHLRTRHALKRGRHLVVGVPSDVGFDLADSVADPRRSPEEKLLQRERRTRFMARCRELIGDRTPGRDLLVFYLAFFEGCSSREICGRLGQGLTPSTIDSLVHRLKKRLSQEGVEIPRRRPGAAIRRR